MPTRWLAPPPHGTIAVSPSAAATQVREGLGVGASAEVVYRAFTRNVILEVVANPEPPVPQRSRAACTARASPSETAVRPRNTGITAEASAGLFLSLPPPSLLDGPRR